MPEVFSSHKGRESRSEKAVGREGREASYSGNWKKYGQSQRQLSKVVNEQVKKEYRKLQVEHVFSVNVLMHWNSFLGTKATFSLGLG